MLSRFDAFLFDFDGLLVDSEALHYRAYRKKLESLGWSIPWEGVHDYLRVAHAGRDSLRDALYQCIPDLARRYPDWEQFRREKNELLQIELERAAVDLMTGAEELLLRLQEQGKAMAVVTNSTERQVAGLRERYEVLQRIPLWVTRERYTEAKPSPQCYRVAMEILDVAPERCIGFEDSARGVQALQAAEVGQVVWVAPRDFPGSRDFLRPATLHVESLMGVLDLDEKEAVRRGALRS